MSNKIKNKENKEKRTVYNARSKELVVPKSYINICYFTPYFEHKLFHSSDMYVMTNSITYTISRGTNRS